MDIVIKSGTSMLFTLIIMFFMLNSFVYRFDRDMCIHNRNLKVLGDIPNGEITDIHLSNQHHAYYCKRIVIESTSR